MGHFIAHVQALGGHGCQRELGDGEHVVGCERPGCPDCITREFVRRLKRSGATVEIAEIRHWPPEAKNPTTGEPYSYAPENAVVDDLLTGKRTGSFG